METSNLPDLMTEAGDDISSFSPSSKIGILTKDAMYRRLIEAASIQLEGFPIVLRRDDLDADSLAQFELLVVDQEYAIRINAILTAEDMGQGVQPSMVVIQPAMEEPLTGPVGFDSVLRMPETTAQIAAQLSVVLYAHRAFARRYQSAMEELHLNRRIFRSVTSGISVASATQPDMPLIYVNPAFEVMTGYTLEEVAGRNCRFLQGEDRDQPALTLLRQAIRDQHECVVILRNFRKDGTPFWNELSLSPIRNREGQLTHFVGIQTDVTARVEFEAALRESEKLAAVGRLASSIAHEINNPLEAVMNLVYLAHSAEDLPKAQGYLEIADRELRRVKHITSQSLRFYKQSTKPMAVNPTELIDSVLQLYQTRLTDREIRVERRDRCMQSIVCMESEIRQVLNNLISNAIDAMMGQENSLLCIRTREAVEPRHQTPGIVITVSDSGAGIEPESIRNIYKAFYTTKGIGGTGLGLWISSEIVERHRGRLLVRSTQRKGRTGTTFQLFLPYQGLVASQRVS